MSLCTVSDVSEYLGLSESSDDGLLSSLILAAEGMIARHTGRTFDATTDSIRYFNPVTSCRGSWLYFDADLAAAPTTVVNGDGATIASTKYVVQPRNMAPYYAIKLLGSSGVSWTYTTDPDSAIVITGKWGYSTAPPDEVRHACTRLAAFLYRQRDNAGDSDRTIVTQAGVVKPLTMPADIATLLQPYVRTTI